MNCDPSALMGAAKCYQCIPPGQRGSVMTYLECQWANRESPEFPCGIPSDYINISGTFIPEKNGLYVKTSSVLWTGPSYVIGGENIEYTLAFTGSFWELIATSSIFGPTTWYTSSAIDFPCTWISEAPLQPPATGEYIAGPETLEWNPRDEVANWSDSGGPHTGDWNTFQSTADLPTVSSLVFTGTATLSSLLGLNFVPALQLLTCSNSNITTLDCYNHLLLTSLDCSLNSISDLNVSSCPVLTTLDCHANSLGTLNITGDFAITTLDFSSNPAVVIIGP